MKDRKKIEERKNYALNLLDTLNKKGLELNTSAFTLKSYDEEEVSKAIINMLEITVMDAFIKDFEECFDKINDENSPFGYFTYEDIEFEFSEEGMFEDFSFILFNEKKENISVLFGEWALGNDSEGAMKKILEKANRALGPLKDPHKEENLEIIEVSGDWTLISWGKTKAKVLYMEDFYVEMLDLILKILREDDRDHVKSFISENNDLFVYGNTDFINFSLSNNEGGLGECITINFPVFAEDFMNLISKNFGKLIMIASSRSMSRDEYKKLYSKTEKIVIGKIEEITMLLDNLMQ